MLTTCGYNETLPHVIQPEKQFENNWSLRSSDLTPLIECLKSKVYANQPTITHVLKEEIERCINEIRPHTYEMVMENVD